MIGILRIIKSNIVFLFYNKKPDIISIIMIKYLICFYTYFKKLNHNTARQISKIKYRQSRLNSVEENFRCYNNGDDSYC